MQRAQRNLRPLHRLRLALLVERSLQRALQIHRLESTRPVLDRPSIRLRSLLTRAHNGSSVHGHELEPPAPRTVFSSLAVAARTIPLTIPPFHERRIYVNETHHDHSRSAPR